MTGVLVVRADTAIQGEIRNCRQIEIYGYVEGQLAAEKVLVHKGGRLYGTVKADTADVHGFLEGNIAIKHLISIHSSGTVSGNVRYGQLALEAGGNLSADVRNVPPTLSGDFELLVDKGRSVRVTLQDLTAFDPDNAAKELVFTISNATHGFLSLAEAPGRPIDTFTQADLQSGVVSFTHDGTNSEAASFDVVVADSAGATSGQAKTVNVMVRSR